MESSPLTLAHDHARAASIATQSSETTVAINEHTLAAGEFARAATGTGSLEALRTLRLLEAHHQKLSELLRFPTANPPAANNSTATESEVQAVAEKPISTSAAVAELRASKSDLGPRSSPAQRNPPSLNHPRRLPPRDLSSSIASNLASARGIRANYTRQPLSPSVSAQQAPGTLEGPPRRDGKQSKAQTSIPGHSPPSWVPPSTSVSKKSEPQVSWVSAGAQQISPTPAPNDEGFSRFYNTFENILSKLSAPLAFAGLPLIAEEDSTPPPESSPQPRRRPSGNKERTTSDPDLTKYFSRAALRASVRDGQSGNDSFYVVPTTGHTVSYAHILSFDQKEKRRMAASIYNENSDFFSNQDEEEDFVDARETPMPSSPAFSRQGSRQDRKVAKEMENKVEELGIENQSLKDCIDKLTKRLHAFEMSAQHNGMALQESMRLMRDLSPAREQSFGSTIPVSPVGGDTAWKQRVQELEEHVSLGGKEIERLGRENEKFKAVISRYRERWEKLKEGAKTRREGNGIGNAAEKESQKRKDTEPVE